MKKTLILLSTLLSSIVLADAPQVWMTNGSIIQWDCVTPDDPIRTGWNIVLAQQSITNMPSSDLLRSQDLGNTNRVIAWSIISDPAKLRLSASVLLNNFQWQNGTLMVSARDAFGNYSDWIGIEVYNPNPKNVRLK